MMRRSVFLAVLVATLGLVGCNTMAGLGRDIERGGDNLENAAERNRKQ